MLTQSEADALIALPKRCIVNQKYCFPTVGNLLSIPLRSNDDKEEFQIDVNRGKIRLTKCTYQERHRAIIVLIRLDIDGPPHTNPDVISVPLQYLSSYNGKELPCPHLHIYVEGFMEKWAIPAPLDKFKNMGDLFLTISDFFKYCNVTNPPIINKSITQKGVFDDFKKL